MRNSVSHHTFREARPLVAVTACYGLPDLLASGQAGAARLVFLRLSPEQRCDALMSLPEDQALCLLARLSNYMMLGLLERLPSELSEQLRAGLPTRKRLGMAALRDHHAVFNHSLETPRR